MQIPRQIYVDCATIIKALDGTEYPNLIWGIYRHGLLMRHMDALESSLVTAAYMAGYNVGQKVKVYDTTKASYDIH